MHRDLQETGRLTLSWTTREASWCLGRKNTWPLRGTSTEDCEETNDLANIRTNKNQKLHSQSEDQETETEIENPQRHLGGLMSLMLEDVLSFDMLFSLILGDWTTESGNGNLAVFRAKNMLKLSQLLV